MEVVKIKILVVDDEHKIVEVLKAYLEKESYEVITSYGGNEALNIFKTESPDLILLDLMLPDISGEELCKTIRLDSKVPIIMITAKTEEEAELEGLNIGADDYITKPFSAKQVVARVKALIRRSYDELVSNNIWNFNNSELIMNIDTREVIVRGQEVILTTTEFNLLITLAKYPKRLFSRDDLISLALRDESECYDRVVDSHIKNLRQKIEFNSKNPEIIMTVYGVGYKFDGKKS